MVFCFYFASFLKNLRQSIQHCVLWHQEFSHVSGQEHWLRASVSACCGAQEGSFAGQEVRGVVPHSEMMRTGENTS